MRKRGKYRALFVVVTAVAIMLVLLILHRLVDRPPGKPTRIANVSGWFIEVDGYKWLSDRRLVALTGRAEEDWHLSQIDVRSGKRTPVDVFNATFGKREMTDPLAWDISQDGKWIVWTGGRDRQPTWNVAQLEGSVVMRLPRSAHTTSRCRWMRDNRHWVQWVEGTSGIRVRLHDARNVGQELPVADIPSSGIVIGTVNSNRLMVCESMTTDRLYLAEYDITTKPRVVRTATVGIPVGRGEITEMLLSPDGSHIAFDIHRPAAEPRSEIIQRLAKLMGLRWRAEASIWIGKIGNTHSEEVWRGEYDQNPPGYLAWLPDSKRVSFIAAGSLWIANQKE